MSINWFKYSAPSTFYALAGKLVPWFAVADADASARMTARELLNQTSGLTTREGNAYHASDDQDVGALERGVRRTLGILQRIEHFTNGAPTRCSARPSHCAGPAR